MAAEQLKFVFSGEQAEAAADALIAALAVPATDVTRAAAHPLPGDDRKIIDPVALATLIISVPPAILATMDLVDRMAKRRKAQAVIDAARRVKLDLNVEITLIAGNRLPQPLAALDPDALLEAASPPGFPGR